MRHERPAQVESPWVSETVPFLRTRVSGCYSRFARALATRGRDLERLDSAM